MKVPLQYSIILKHNLQFNVNKSTLYRDAPKSCVSFRRIFLIVRPCQIPLCNLCSVTLSPSSHLAIIFMPAILHRVSRGSSSFSIHCSSSSSRCSVLNEWLKQIRYKLFIIVETDCLGTNIQLSQTHCCFVVYSCIVSVDFLLNGELNITHTFS